MVKRRGGPEEKACETGGQVDCRELTYAHSLPGSTAKLAISIFNAMLKLYRSECIAAPTSCGSCYGFNVC